MDALAPLIGVMIMSIMLVVNFFRAAWQLGILRAFGRRHPLTWRALAAAALAACLPMLGVLLTLTLVPADDGLKVALEATELAVQLATCGFVMHLLNDQLTAWGRTPRQA